VELKEQPFAPTLASRLGDVPHVSGLLRRIAQISGASERVADWLFKVAVQRGASHYQRQFDPTLPPDSPAVSDEEIGVWPFAWASFPTTSTVCAPPRNCSVLRV
jgi:hypothetical protein